MKEKKFLYSNKVKEHFLNPKNFITDKETKEWNKKADGIGETGSPACGDVMKVWITVENNKIKECKWQTYGCASAIASTSIMSEMAKGKTIEQAEAITAKEITDKLGGLPQIKIHCSVLGNQALKAAIQNYKERKKGEKMKEEKTTKKITKNTQIIEAVRLNPKTGEILISEGIHCPTCPMAAMETIEQGLKAHGKTEKEIEEIIKKINKK
jgi:hybrid cluster-associated redox disulfide protein